jgi:hypothetical protein
MAAQEKTIRTLEDGTVVESQPGYAKFTRLDGTTHEHFYGGHEQIIRPNGTRINKWADGSEWSYLPDGTTTVKRPDGRIETIRSSSIG